MGIDGGVEVHHVADLPARTGLRTSSAFTVGFLLSRYAPKNQMRDKHVAVGNLKNRRSIADVCDLVQGLWLAAEHCRAGEVYNIGGDDVYSVEQFTDMIRTQGNIQLPGGAAPGTNALVRRVGHRGGTAPNFGTVATGNLRFRSLPL